MSPTNPPGWKAACCSLNVSVQRSDRCGTVDLGRAGACRAQSRQDGAQRDVVCEQSPFLTPAPWLGWLRRGWGTAWVRAERTAQARLMLMTSLWGIWQGEMRQQQLKRNLPSRDLSGFFLVMFWTGNKPSGSVPSPPLCPHHESSPYKQGPRSSGGIEVSLFHWLGERWPFSHDAAKFLEEKMPPTQRNNQPLAPGCLSHRYITAPLRAAALDSLQAPATVRGQQHSSAIKWYFWISIDLQSHGPSNN